MESLTRMQGGLCDFMVTIQQARFLGLMDRYSLACGGFKGGEVLLSPFVASIKRIFALLSE